MKSELTGYVMVEQVKSADARSRKAKRIEKGIDALLSEALFILDACISESPESSVHAAPKFEVCPGHFLLPDPASCTRLRLERKRGLISQT